VAGPRFSATLIVHDASGSTLGGLTHSVRAVQHLEVRNESPRPYEFQAWTTPSVPTVTYPEASSPATARTVGHLNPGETNVGHEAVEYNDPARSTSTRVIVQVALDVKDHSTPVWTSQTLPPQYIDCL
jgi:hypothetical protein